MPTYTYRCTECEEFTNLTVKMVDRDGDYDCPQCDGPLKRKIGVNTQTPIIEGNRVKQKKILPPGMSRDEIDPAWARDT